MKKAVMREKEKGQGQLMIAMVKERLKEQNEEDNKARLSSARKRRKEVTATS